MSASNKKKLRKEQNVAELTEKQRRNRSEAKKLKTYTTTFVVILLVLVLVTVGTLGARAINRSGVFEKNTIAATVNGHKLNTVMLAYYYGDTIESAYSQWIQDYGTYFSSYAQLLGLDLSKPLNKSVYDQESGQTWAEYFAEAAMENAKSDYALYDKAVAEGFELPKEDAEALDTAMNNLKNVAANYGYGSVKSYLSAYYGYGSDAKSFRQYQEVSALARAYYNAHRESLTYDADAIAKYDGEHSDEYCSYTGAYYYVSYNSFLEGGTKNENGNTVYSDEEQDAARQKAKEAAESLLEATNLRSFDSLIAQIKTPASSSSDSSSATSTKYQNTLYSGISPSLQKWFADDAREENDIEMIPNDTTVKDADGNETTKVNGYYVALFQSRTDNTTPLVGNVRHILLGFEGGTKDEDGNTVYSDEEKKAAKDKADALLEQWKNGEATEDSFIALVKDNTSDSGSAQTGGLYENITPASRFVDSFRDWALAEGRKAGDVEIVESEYGYHIMYYVGDSGSYRNFMITSDMRTADMEAWYKDIVDNATLTSGKINRLRLDRVLSAY